LCRLIIIISPIILYILSFSSSFIINTIIIITIVST
jgi:hypothetical protein